MGRITVKLDDELERNIRMKIAKEGGKKGDLTKAADEGLRLWVEQPDINIKNIDKLLESKSYTFRKHINIDENNDIVTTYSLLSGDIGKVIDIKCPPNNVIMIKGILQLCKNETREDAHSITLRFADKDNTEIDGKIRVNCKLIEPFGEEKLVLRDFYSQFSSLKKDGTNKEYNEFFRLNQSIIINEGYILRLYVENPNIDIDHECVFLHIDADILI